MVVSDVSLSLPTSSWQHTLMTYWETLRYV